MVEQGQLSFGHAKALMALDSPETMQLMAQRVAAAFAFRSPDREASY